MNRTATVNTSAAATPAPAIGCMEIWGGNDAFNNAISLRGLDAWVVSRPYGGGNLGGDIHYISTCGHGHIARFMIADVAGHGPQVSPIAAELRRLMRRYINTLDQTRFVRALNREFQAVARGDRPRRRRGWRDVRATSGIFATALLTSYFAPTHDLLVCNAGHPRPMWYRADRGDWVILDQTVDAPQGRFGNLPIGIIDPTDYSQFSVALSPGDLVVLHSDGLTESKSPTGECIGEAGLLNLVRTLDPHNPATIAPQLVAALDAYRGQAAPDDDFTLIVLHHNGADPKRLKVSEWLKSAGKMLGLLRI